MVKLLLPGFGADLVEPEDEDEGDRAHIDFIHSQKMDEDLSIQNMLRDNLYANRTRVELSGQIKYRRLHNEAISSFKV